MILSNNAIIRALESGHIILEPKPFPATPQGGSDDCPYQTSAVDLRLGKEVSWINKKLPIHINLKDGGLSKLLADNSESRILKDSEPYILEPQKFVLGKTLERIELPISDTGPWFAARVEGRSSYARCGLLVHFTAPTIHAGFKGTITLEIMNFGVYPIALYPSTPICQLIFEQLTCKPFRNDSQFQGQMSAGGRSEIEQRKPSDMATRGMPKEALGPSSAN